MKTSNHKTLILHNRKAVYLAVASCLVTMNASAAPVNGHFVHGSGTITVNGKVMTIANSPSAIINWDNFDIDPGEVVRFIQKSSASAVLNRDFSGNPSEILGSLTSNGKVFLINPAGVIFGTGSQIDTAGLIASSLNITNEDFLHGRLNFNADRLNPGSVINNGNISTSNGGFVYLIAPNVENSGIIKTPSGETILAAGNSVEIVNSNDPMQRVLVSATSKDINLSQAITDSGSNIFKVMNSGKIQANSAVMGKNGKVYLRSAGDIETTADSTIETKGGNSTNGGLIQALAAGDGLYFGSMLASGKNGGFIETSASYLDINSLDISTKAIALHGKDGNWLIDPANIEIVSSGTNNCGSGGNFSCSTDTSVILVSTLTTALSSSNVTIDTGTCTSCTAAGDITVNAAINSTSTRSLTMTADGSITVNNNISIGGDLSMAANGGSLTSNANLTAASLDLYAIDDVTLNGAVKATKVLASTPINIESQFGNININAGLSSTLAADINLTAGNNININAAVTTVGGDIGLTADSAGSGTGAVNIGSIANSSTFKVDAGTGIINISSANANIINAGVTSKELYADLTGTLTVGDATAILPSYISTSVNQEINAANIYVRAGSGQTVSSVYNSAQSFILSKGDQKLTVTGLGSIGLYGNNNGTDNSAKIAIQGDGTQSIDSDYYLTLQAGNANGANASIDGSTGSQTIKSSYIDISAGAANDSSAGIDTGAVSTVTALNSLTMNGGSSSSSNAGDFTAAYIGSDTQAVNLTLNANNLNVYGGTVSGTNPGAVIGAIGKNATITMNVSGTALFDASSTTNANGIVVGTTLGKSTIQVNASDFSMTGQAIMGSKSASSGSSLEINTDNELTIGDNAIAGFTTSAGAVSGTVTLDADTINETGSVYASTLIASADSGITLTGSNKVNTFEATNNTTGNLSFHDDLALTISTTGVFNYANDGSINISSNDTLKTGTGDGIQNLGAGIGSIVLSSNSGISIQDGSVVNNGSGLSQLNADGDISIGAGGIISSGDVSLYATNIKGSGVIDLGGVNDVVLYASNNIGTATKTSTGTTFSPVNVNANTISATAGGTNIIVANLSDSLTSASLNGVDTLTMSSTNLSDAVLFTYNDLTNTTISSDAAGLSIIGKSGTRTYTNLNVYGSSSDVLLSGTGLNINGSNIYSHSVAVVASSVSLKDSYLSANNSTGDISLFGTTIKLDNTDLWAHNVYFNANASSFSSVPGSAVAIADLLNFASASNITIDNRSFIYANNDVDILAGTLKVNSSGIEVGHEVLAAIKGNMTINGGDGGEGSYIYASDEVRLAVGGDLALNSSSDLSGRARIEAGSPDTIYVDFPLSGNFIVDGKKGAVTSTKNISTGFFVNGTAAVVGDTLEIRNGSTKETEIKEDEIEPVKTVVSDILKSTKENETDKNSSSSSKVSKAKTEDEDNEFFGDKDENKDNKNSNKKSQPKQCS